MSGKDVAQITVNFNMRFVKESNLLIGCCKIRYWGADSMILAYLEEQV